ncbi:MAG: hypothetical protein JWO72_762 [Caulobacteraceae bacterium]|nr:hypothetical protein [Caulobacteraceae bacterium]
MTTPPAPFLVATFRAFRDRPRISAAIVAGLLTALALQVYSADLRWSTRAIVSWDAAALCFIVLMTLMMCDCGVDKIEARAAAQDEGRGLTLFLSITAATASVLAIAIELSLAKTDHGIFKPLRVGLAFATITLSWFFVHLIFALHYAHEYYSPDDDGSDPHRGGLGFPGNEPPDYWDFVHFAVIIGVASQTADISFTSKPLRRIGTLHGVLSFVFNTVVLALTINLVAGLF